MIDDTVYPITDSKDLLGKTVLLKSWLGSYEPKKPFRHLIRKVTQCSINDGGYFEFEPIIDSSHYLIERYPLSTKEGIITEEYAEQLLSWEILTHPLSAVEGIITEEYAEQLLSWEILTRG